MKKLLLTMVFFCLVATLPKAQAQTIRSIYTNPNFSQLTKDHKELAIIPFEAVVKLRPKQMKDMSAEDLARLEEQEGESVQSALYSYFLKRQSRNDYTVGFQDISRTNALLAKNGITYENMGEFTIEELAEMLDVDGIISGRIITDKPMSEGGAIALGLLVGVYVPTNTGKIGVSIKDGATGELLWNYEKALGRSMGSDNNQIINALMRKASRKFPYKK